MTIYVDIDGTICDTPGADYPGAKPIPERIGKFNRMYDKGNRIVYWTARGAQTGIDWSALTRAQLQAWGCKYHGIEFGKPFFDLYICDKVLNVKDL